MPFASDLDFLAGDCEMARRFRDMDWDRTDLGPPAAWPMALRMAVRILLTTRHPMFIFWGPSHICMYNNSYLPVLGPEKHPAIFGMAGAAAWPESWATIGSQIDFVRDGHGATWNEDQCVPIMRNGVLEDVYWTYGYSPLEDPAAPHGIGGVLVIGTETTARVLAERRINGEVVRLHRLFDQAPGFMCVLRGPGHVFELANQAYTDLVTRADLIGRRVADVLPEAAAQGFTTLLDRVYATGEPYVGTHQRLVFDRGAGSDPDERILNFVYAPVVDDAGRVAGVFCQGTDITDKARAERAVAQSEGRFRAAVHAIQGVLWTNDAAGRMVGTQQAWAALTGQSPAEYAGFGWTSAVHPDDAAGTVTAWLAAVADRRIFAHEHRVRRFDGEWRDFSVRAVPIRDADGAIVEWVGIHTDITEQRNAEAALLALNDDLETRVATEVAARVKVETSLRQSQKMDALGQLAGGITHDFNNMLSVISGVFNLLKRRLPDADSATLQYVEAGQSATMRAAELTRRMLGFARQQPLLSEKVDVNQLVDSLRQLLDHALGRSITLELLLATDPWPTLVDPNQLENAILNLAVNARDAMDRGGRLVIATANVTLDAGARPDGLAGGFVRLSVEDDGAGMTAEVRARVLEPFFTTKPAGQGTGLGLSQVHGLVTDAGGAIEIVSAPGAGTQVALYLPRAPQP